MKIRDTTTASILQALQQWVRRNGLLKVLITDNATYYASSELRDWCTERSTKHKFIAPYRHQNVGLVERYHQTLINRIRKMKLLAKGVLDRLCKSCCTGDK